MRKKDKEGYRDRQTEMVRRSLLVQKMKNCKKYRDTPLQEKCMWERSGEFSMPPMNLRQKTTGKSVTVTIPRPLKIRDTRNKEMGLVTGV